MKLLPVLLVSFALLHTPEVVSAQNSAAEPIAQSAVTTPVQFETRAQATAAPIPATAASVFIRGYFAGGDGGAALYKRLSTAPADPAAWNFQSADGAWWQMAGPTVSIRAFGAKGDERNDDTSATQDFFAALPVLGASGYVDGGRYSVNPVTLSKLRGVRVEGAGVDASLFLPRTASQPHVLLFDKLCHDWSIDGIGISGLNFPKAKRPLAGVISEMTQYRIKHIAVRACGIGFWFRRGGYGTVEQMDLLGCSDSYLKTGGNKDGVQAAEFLVKNVLVDGQYGAQGGPKPTAENFKAAAAATGIGLDIDSRSAYIKFDHITGAGTAYGVLIHDSEGGDVWNARATRPDGIYFRDLNFDWGGNAQLQINSAGLVDIDLAWLRSLGTAAVIVQNFANLHLRNCNAYASHLEGLRVQGNFQELTLDNPGIAGNAWPLNSAGGVNLHLVAGSGRVAINGGEICNPKSADGDFPVNSVSNVADYNIVAEPEFTGPLSIVGTSLRNGRVAASSGVIDRARTRIVNCEGLELSTSGHLTATTDAKGHILIPHNLRNGPAPLAPASASITINTVGRFANVTAMDAANLEIAVTDATGNPIANTSFDFRWTAEH
jgi:hypothetical protein